ncbi:hydrolase [Pseudomonas sp. UL073]|uniref:Hydrolase n=1 Tax=Zestomonas insulae TaxID=2809017 RepID=A0ABS2IB17_9GAMM|nr:hydrolase [Pseudomonas insulae]MBM7060222.1 hydrolase [Pseudomonas insulae]
MLIDAHKATLLVVDVQQRLIGAVTDPAGTLARIRWLLQVAGELDLPVVISEQYPQGLGPTVTELSAVAPAARVVEKRHFSCVAADCLPADVLAREQLIVCGMETHVCVLQTVLDLCALGKQVFVVDDACASRTAYSHATGIQRMRDAGAQIVSREMVAFECLHSSSHAKFRLISKTFLVVEQP